MSELDKEVITSKDSESTTDSSANSESSESNTDSSESKKKFDVWKEYKRLKKENKILLTENDDDFSEEEKEAEKEASKDNSFNEVKYDIFLLRNPDAEEYQEEIKNTLKKFDGMSYVEAFAFAKANYTKSKTTKDFSTKSATPKKDLWDYSKEEILATKDKKKLLEWSRLQGRIR